MDEHQAKALLSKDRAFLFLSIVTVIALLTGFPHSLKAFILGTTGKITGGAIAVEPIGMKDYLIGLVIFAGLMVFLGYLVYALRNPKPEVWYPQIDEDDELAATVDRDMDLEDNIEKINRQIKNLQNAQEKIPLRKAKKVTKIPNMLEIQLEHTLRSINAQLQGYRKAPIILEAPGEKGEWDEHLKQVQEELANVDKMKFKDVKIRRKIPLVTKTSGTLEQMRLARELQKLHQLLEEEEKSTPLFGIKRCLPASREWQLADIKKHIRKKGAVHNKKELAKIERKLAKLYKEN